MSRRPAPFIPVEGREYAPSLDQAEPGQWLIIRDVNESRICGPQGILQAQVVSRTNGTLTISHYGRNRKVSLGSRNPFARGRLGHFDWAQGLAEYEADVVHAENAELLQRYNVSTTGTPPALVPLLAETVRRYEQETTR